MQSDPDDRVEPRPGPDALSAGDAARWELGVESGAFGFDDRLVADLGYDPGRFSRRSEFAALLPAPDRERVAASMAAHLAGETDRYDVEYRIRASDGTLRWFHDVGAVTERDDGGEPTRVAGVARDVTERRTDRSTRLTEQALDAAPVGITVSDSLAGDEPLVYVNEAFETLTGYDAAAAVGRNCRFLQCEETDPETVDRMRAAVAAGDPVAVVVRNERADGERFWNEVHLAPIRDADGVVTNYVGVQQDVTEREEHERKLGRLQERSQTLMYTQSVSETAGVAVRTAHELVDAGVSGFWALNEAGDVLEPRATVEASTGLDGEAPSYPRDAPAGSRAAISWETFERGEPLWIDDTRAYEPLTEETAVRSLLLYPVGDHGLLVTASPEPGGITDSDRRLVDILETVLDTALDRVDRETELRERERRLARQNDRLEGLHEATAELLEADSRSRATSLAVSKLSAVLGLPNAGLWLHDADRNVLDPVAFADDAMAFADGRPTYGPGEDLAWLAFDEDRSFAFDDLDEVPAGYEPDTGIRSGLVIPLSGHGVIKAGSTSPDAFDGVDVTFTKLWARTVTQVLERFEDERRLTARNAELSRERDRLEEFASVVSHDLRNPLNVIEGSLDLAEETGDSEYFERGRAGVDRIDTLVDDLLALARTGQAASDLEPVSLARCVRQCWATVSTGGAALELTVDESATVYADPSRLGQLLENLFSNAVQHGTPGDPDFTRGGPADEDGAATVTVTVGSIPGGFYVADDGTGIPPEERERVRERGYSTAADGTGFGLSIVGEIAAAHGWEMTITEGADGGARFEFTGVDVAE